MLDLAGPLRKNSFGAGLQRRRTRGRVAESREVLEARPGQERQGHGRREAPGCAGRRSGPPAARPSGGARRSTQGVRRRRRAGRRPGPRPARSRSGCRGRGEDPGVRIEAQDQEGPPAHVPGQVDPLGQGHLGKPPQEVPVRRPADRRMHPGVGREVRPGPARRASRRARGRRVRGVRGCAASARRTAWNFRAPRSAEDLLESLRREVGPPQKLQALALGAACRPYCLRRPSAPAARAASVAASATRRPSSRRRPGLLGRARRGPTRRRRRRRAAPRAAPPPASRSRSRSRSGARRPRVARAPHRRREIAREARRGRPSCPGRETT